MIRSLVLTAYLLTLLPCILCYRVAIVGAGIAGLSAASVLEKEGIEYIIFEGADRVGGRILSQKHGDGYFQHGAEFISGKDNEIYRIAEYHNLIVSNDLDFDEFDINATYYLGGIHVNREDLIKWLDYVRPLDNKFYEDAPEFPSMSVAERFQKKYERFLDVSSDEEEEMNKKKPLYDALAKIYRSFQELSWSAPVHKIALKNLIEWDDGSNISSTYTLNNQGFHQILANLSSRVPSEKIRLNTVVRNIDTSKDTIRIRTDSGSLESFDYVIVTSSLGYLKKYEDKMFNPKLPKEKKNVIKHLGFDSVVKIFLEYEQRWWENDTISILTVPKKKVGMLSNVLRLFEPSTMDKNVLVAWVAGAKGPNIIKSLTDEELISRITKHLIASSGKHDIPKPIHVYRHNWVSDELHFGSHSYLTPESVKKLDDPFKDMAEPIWENDSPVIMFAGEHTHSTMYQTASGAFESGRREALRIVEDLRNSTKVF